MGFLIRSRVSFFSSPEDAVKILSKMRDEEAREILSSMRGKRLLLLLSRLDRKKEEELLQGITPQAYRRIFNSLDNKQLLYFLSSFRPAFRRNIVQMLPLNRIMSVLQEVISDEKSSFLSLFETDKLTEIFEVMQEKKILANLIKSFNPLDRIDLLSRVKPAIIHKIISSLKKEEILDLAEKIPQEHLKDYLNGLPEKEQKTIYRKLPKEKLFHIISSIKGKKEFSIIIKSVEIDIFFRMIAKLPKEKINILLPLFSEKEKAAIFNSFDMTIIMDIISILPVDEQAKYIAKMDVKRASLVVNGMATDGSKLQILRMLPLEKAVEVLGTQGIDKQINIMKKLPLEAMIRIFEVMPAEIQKEIMDEWDMKKKHETFKIIQSHYAARVLRSFSPNIYLDIIQKMKYAQCAKIMSYWSVEEILNDFREPVFYKNLRSLLGKMEKNLRSNIIKAMDPALRKKLELDTSQLKLLSRSKG